ncbi:plastocyanin/azurin family copper-binding protein [Deinococcus sp.]|uniref:plastocyanin/azurin family copper-binding protein n=1 Tax=Deinococcus sp. TaxID=47478 RepID=UPI002869A0B2|nr:plastocyanin/azurin family copper-binding protein [Deinococcus sp.]
MVRFVPSTLLSCLLPLCALLSAGAQAQSVQVFPFAVMPQAAGASGQTAPSGQLSVRAISAAQSLSVLTLRGLKPDTAYVAHYHALGPGGGEPCASNGPVTLGFPAFKTDARGQATVSLRADPARLRGTLGAYVNVHAASDLTSVPLCAAVLKSAATTSKTTPAPGVTVKIGDNTFMPGTLTIPAGTTITWLHTGKITHNVLSLTLTDLKSPDLRPGDTYSHTFKTPGTYTYYCSYHDGMSATITVTNR